MHWIISQYYIIYFFSKLFQIGHWNFLQVGTCTIFTCPYHFFFFFEHSFTSWYFKKFQDHLVCSLSPISNQLLVSYQWKMIIERDCNTPIISMHRSSRQKISQAKEILNYTTEQLDLIDLFRALHPKNPQYTFFSNANEIFSRTDQCTKQDSTNLRVQKLSQVSFLSIQHEIRN